MESKQCPEFVHALLQSGDEMLIEDTNDEYWARGTTGHVSNILGELLMLLRDALQSSSSSLQAYCPMKQLHPATIVERIITTKTLVDTKLLRNVEAASGWDIR